MLFRNFGKLHSQLILPANLMAIFLSGSLAAKSIFTRGLNGFAFNITKKVLIYSGRRDGGKCTNDVWRMAA
jgi:hypothetical protein